MVDCYGDRDIRINLETKLSPIAPNETLSVDTYVNSPLVIPMLKKRNFLKRTDIHSFDWRTLVAIKKIYGNEIPTSALINDITILPMDGEYPWLGGVDVSGPDLNELLSQT